MDRILAIIIGWSQVMIPCITITYMWYCTRERRHREAEAITAHNKSVYAEQIEIAGYRVRREMLMERIADERRKKKYIVPMMKIQLMKATGYLSGADAQAIVVGQ